MSAETSPTSPRDEELEHAREVLERTMRYLSRCAEDPVAGPRSDDPRRLEQELKGLAVGPEAPLEREESEQDAPAAEPRTIPLRRRRSA